MRSIRTGDNIVMTLPLNEAGGFIRLLEEAGKAIRDGRIVGSRPEHTEAAADQVDKLVTRLRSLHQNSGPKLVSIDEMFDRPQDVTNHD